MPESLTLNRAAGRPENASFYHEDREGHEEMTFWKPTRPSGLAFTHWVHERNGPDFP